MGLREGANFGKHARVYYIFAFTPSLVILSGGSLRAIVFIRRETLICGSYLVFYLLLFSPSFGATET